jgi:hypothetical protein
MALIVHGQKTALWLLPVGLACAVAAKDNVPFVGWHKIALKKMFGAKKKKNRSIGNECRLTRCLFAICAVCWSPVKMVYFFLVIVSYYVVVVLSNTLTTNSNIHQTSKLNPLNHTPCNHAVEKKHYKKRKFCWCIYASSIAMIKACASLSLREINM